MYFPIDTPKGVHLTPVLPVVVSVTSAAYRQKPIYLFAILIIGNDDHIYLFVFRECLITWSGQHSVAFI